MSRNEPGLRAWSHFLGAHALALRVIEEGLAAAGQPPIAWYDVLLELDRVGGRLRIGELGERLVIEPYNMTRLLDRLEAEKLLRRERAHGDRRGAFARLTDKGAELRRRMWPHYRKAIQKAFSDALSEGESEAMVQALKKVIGHLRANE
ncbi:MAG TPA: MarR family transcriptional regulator [Xanthobacteraceae bacterium]|jgi:DNA-binding MarR family transcriptional regulator